jgi:hypothetical protein
VGAIYGLSREQLSQAKIVYLGEEEVIPPDYDKISLISEEYRKRRWYIGQLVLEVNFGLASTISAFDTYLSQSYKRFADFGFVKGDELEFLGDLLQELAFVERLPLLTALNVLEWCTALESALRQSNRSPSENSGDSLRTIAGRIALLTNDMLDKLDRALPEIEDSKADQPLCVRATFQEQPSLPLAELLNSIGMMSHLDIDQKSYLVQAKKGSYVEIVFTTLLTVIALQSFLYLINGCIIQITELKHRLKALARKDGPKTYKEMALSPVQPAPPQVLSVLRSLTEYAKGLSWLKQPAMSGYVASNISSLEEVECKEPPNSHSVN